MTSFLITAPHQLHLYGQQSPLAALCSAWPLRQHTESCRPTTDKVVLSNSHLSKMLPLSPLQPWKRYFQAFSSLGPFFPLHMLACVGLKLPSLRGFVVSIFKMPAVIFSGGSGTATIPSRQAELMLPLCGHPRLKNLSFETSPASCRLARLLFSFYMFYGVICTIFTRR